MKIEVRVFATFREGREKKQFLEVKEGAIIKEVIDLVKIDEEEISILLLNGIDGDSERKLSDGDVLALFPPVGGG